MAGVLIMGVAFLLLRRMETIRQFYAICLILAVGLACTGTMSTSYAVSDWFEKKRGTAMGVMMVGVGLGGLIIVPLTRLLVDMFGWQRTFVTYAVGAVLILVPTAGMVFRRRPAELGVLPDGATADAGEDAGQTASRSDNAAELRGWVFRDAVRTRTFWVVVVAFILATFGQTGLLINQVAYFQDIGISPDRAAGALGLCALLGIAGKLFFGAMADRYPVRYAMALCFGLQAIGTVILLFTSAIGSTLWFVLVWGFAMGGIITLEPLIAGECFGMKSFGVVLGMMYVCTTVGASLGPPFGGWMFDINKSYVAAFVVFIVAYALSTGLSFFAVPPGPAHGKTQ
jgi:MFS family permease